MENDKKIIRREVQYRGNIGKLLQARARKKGFMYAGKPSEKAYIEYLIFKDLKKIKYVPQKLDL